MEATETRVSRTRMLGEASNPAGPRGSLVRSSNLAVKSLRLRKKPSTPLSKTTTRFE